MRVSVVLASLSLLVAAGCTDSGPGSSGDAGPRGAPVVSPPGFYHLPHPTTATTLFLQPGGVARIWIDECDSMGELSGATWRGASSSTAELDTGATSHLLTFQDGGTLLVDPPLFPAPGPAPEVWSPGAACSVCMPGWPLAVVGCATPDAGVVGVCCAGACNGGTPASVSCTYGGAVRSAGAGADAVPAGQCRCPTGSVAAPECTAYQGVFCGGGSPD